MFYSTKIIIWSFLDVLNIFVYSFASKRYYAASIIDFCELFKGYEKTLILDVNAIKKSHVQITRPFAESSKKFETASNVHSRQLPFDHGGYVVTGCDEIRIFSLALSWRATYSLFYVEVLIIFIIVTPFTSLLIIRI